MAQCTECGASVTIPKGAIQGEIIDCPQCGIELEITNPATQQLRKAQIDGEDWGQ